MAPSGYVFLYFVYQIDNVLPGCLWAVVKVYRVASGNFFYPNSHYRNATRMSHLTIERRKLFHFCRLEVWLLTGASFCPCVLDWKWPTGISKYRGAPVTALVCQRRSLTTGRWVLWTYLVVLVIGFKALVGNLLEGAALSCPTLRVTGRRKSPAFCCWPYQLLLFVRLCGYFILNSIPLHKCWNCLRWQWLQGLFRR